MNSNESFGHFRRFGWLSCRILLHDMIQLTELETKICELDAKDATNKTMEFRLRGYEDYPGWDDKMTKLINEARTKWKEYGSYIK